MQGIADHGPAALVAMWTFTAVVFIFVLLRIYTRFVVVKSYGIDDHVYVFAFILLLLNAVFIHMAALHGFGQNLWEIKDPNDIKWGIIYVCVAQTFMSMGIFVAKWSLGLFLLRLVKEKWHKILIWAVLVNLVIASIFCLGFFWFNCEPVAFMWDRTIDGKCELPQVGAFVYVGASSVFADLFFAGFPWFFMWRLQMDKREKLIILISMSLGVVAGACGIARSTYIPSLMSKNYLHDCVGIVVWCAAENAVTLVCIGIPVCRPLYKGYLNRITTRNASSRYKDISGRDMPLRTIGGRDLQPSHMSMGFVGSRVEKGKNSSSVDGIHVRNDISSRSSIAIETMQNFYRESPGGSSDEEPLKRVYMPNERVVREKQGPGSDFV